MSNAAPAPIFGKLTISGREINLAGIDYHQVAIFSQKLLALSVVTHGQIVKAMRSILSGGAPASLHGTGLPITREATDRAYAVLKNEYDLTAVGSGYTTYVHKLDYGLAHALFIAREPGFLPVVTAESVWLELMADRFTTPLLPEWMPHVEKELRDHNLLVEAECANCQCGLLLATTEQLDVIVSEGLRDGHLQIPRNPKENADG